MICSHPSSFETKFDFTFDSKPSSKPPSMPPSKLREDHEEKMFWRGPPAPPSRRPLFQTAKVFNGRRGQPLNVEIFNGRRGSSSSVGRHQDLKLICWPASSTATRWATYFLPWKVAAPRTASSSDVRQRISSPRGRRSIPAHQMRMKLIPIDVEKISIFRFFSSRGNCKSRLYVSYAQTMFVLRWIDRDCVVERIVRELHVVVRRDCVWCAEEVEQKNHKNIFKKNEMIILQRLRWLKKTISSEFGI